MMQKKMFSGPGGAMILHLQGLEIFYFFFRSWFRDRDKNGWVAL
jgi:hypothetical protein